MADCGDVFWGSRLFWQLFLVHGFSSCSGVRYVFVSPYFPIILLNWAILACILPAISLTFVIVTSVLNAAGAEHAGLYLQFSFSVDVCTTFGRFDFLIRP